MSINCIQTHAPELEKDYNELVSQGASEKVAAITVATIEYEKLIDELNDLKTSVGVTTQKNNSQVADIERIKENSKLDNSAASRKLAEIAKAEGINLASLTREEYAEYAIKNGLRITDNELRNAPELRNPITMDETMALRKSMRESLTEATKDLWNKWTNSIEILASKSQKERYILNEVRVLSGTANSGSWLFFDINNSQVDSSQAPYKSYFSLKDFNNITPEKLVAFMKFLQENGYKGGIKSFQDLVSQGVLLNDQFVMHGDTEVDAKLGERLAKDFFKDEIKSTGFGKDAFKNGKSKSYSQILSDKISSDIDIIIKNNKPQDNTLLNKEKEISSKVEELKTELEKTPKEVEQSLEQQKAQELSEVKPIVVRERVETPSTIETVKDTKEEERLSARKQKIEDSISKLEDGSTSEDRTKVTIDSVNAPKGITYELIGGVWNTKSTFTKKGAKVDLIPADAKALQKIEEKLKENPNTAKIEKLKEQLAEVEQQLENIPTVEREVRQEPTFTETEVENTAEINRINAKYEKLGKDAQMPQEPASQEDNTQQQKDKINREYDQRIQKLKTPPVDNSKAVEDYKNRIERMLAKGYYSLESIGKNYEDLKDLEPTQAEIEEFRKGKVELKEKLSNWKLLDSATDAEGNSIADLVKLIKQLETPQKEADTKTELTGEDIDFLQEGSEASGDIVVNELLQNYLAHAKVKKLTTGRYRFTHLKLSQLINRLITEEVRPTVKGVEVTLAEIDKLKPGAIVTILNTDFILGESGRVEIDVKKFESIKQALGFELLDSGGNWSYHDIYEYNGVEWVKVKSEYEDSTFEQSTSYELKKDDIVSFEIGNENGYNLGLYNNWMKAQKALDESKATNKTKLEEVVKEALKEFKNGITIYAVDSKGRRIAPLKALKSGVAEETFLYLRQRAFDNFDTALDKIDLKVTTKVVNVYLGTPQLLIFDGKTQNTPFTKQTITQVVATGFIQDEEVTTSTEFPNGVDTTFLKKMAKQNKGVKIPFVVIRKGIHALAYPVSLKKGGETKLTELENLTANKTDNEQVIIINDLIQKYSLQIKPLVFGELQDESRVEEVRAAFENYETHISVEKFADKKYDTENLIRDAEINIDLTDMDNAISDPKVRISLDRDVMRFEESKEVLKTRERDLAWQMSDFVDKMYDKIYVSRGVELKDVEKNRFIDIMIDGTENSAPLRATKGESQENADNYKRVNKNVLIEATMYINDLDGKGKEFVGVKNIQEAKKLVAMYKRVQEDLDLLAKNKNSAKKNSEC